MQADAEKDLKGGRCKIHIRLCETIIYSHHFWQSDGPKQNKLQHAMEVPLIGRWSDKAREQSWSKEGNRDSNLERGGGRGSRYDSENTDDTSGGITVVMEWSPLPKSTGGRCVYFAEGRSSRDDQVFGFRGRLMGQGLTN